jgi:ribonuclease D
MAGSSDYKVVSDIPDQLLATYLAAKEIAIDTELQGLRLGRDRVCLVQLCDRAKNVCLVRPASQEPPANLKKLLTHKATVKVFHFALCDVAFFRQSMGITVTPFRCTKVMSKLVRTYTETHSLRSLVSELMGLELDKQNQQSDWQSDKLSQSQLRYAANDVLHLLPIYDTLAERLEQRGVLPSGISAHDLNANAQAVLPALVDLIISGYGDQDDGWQTSVFTH